MLTTLTLTLACACALAVPVTQEDPQERPERSGPPLVSVEDLTLKHYTPEHVALHELAELGKRMVGRQIFVEERGGYQSQAVSNMSTLGDNLVLYDTAAYVTKMLSSLKELDQPGAEGDSGGSARLMTIEYTPSFISLDVALSALGSFQRTVSDQNDSAHNNISFARERGLLVVRDTQDRLTEIEALLKRIDTPKPQVLITCYLVRGGETAGDLPGELSSNLEKLVPGFHFEQVGFGMLQSAVVPNTSVSLKLDTNYGETFELSFVPVAFDRATSSLSVANCTLVKHRGIGRAGGVTVAGPGVRVFSTDTLFRGNEYTVLGASGMEPIFVVIRVGPMGA
jgi:hypothetical protein